MNEFRGNAVYGGGTIGTMFKRIVLITALALFVPTIALAQISGRAGIATFTDNPRALDRTRLAQAAQPADFPIVVSGFIGVVFDTEEDWFFLGGDVRLPIQNRTFEINPRLSYQPIEGGHTTQIDVNVIWQLVLANQGRFRPFAGIGGGVISDTFAEETETKVGFNLIAGTRFALAQSRIQPYVHVQYTMVRDRLNPFAVAFGVGIPLN